MLLTAHESASLFAPPVLALERRPEGALLFRSTEALGESVEAVLDWLDSWAEIAPEKQLLFERSADGENWRAIDLATLQTASFRVGQGLLSLGLVPGDRILVCARNGIDHLRLAMAAYRTGLVYVPVAAQYGAPGADHRRMGDLIALVDPAFAFVDSDVDVKLFGDLSLIIGRVGIDVIERAPDQVNALPAFDRDAPAKIPMTSGSTGKPKTVIQTQRMMTANIAMTLQVWPFARARPAILVSWAPWSHSFGGNHLLHMALACGGSIYVDDGMGTPHRTLHTIANIVEVRPTFYAAGPAEYETLIPYLEADPVVREALFGRLDLLFTAGAAMNRPTWEKLRSLSAKVRGEPVTISAGWGSTELGPGATMVHAPMMDLAGLGTPMPGVTVKLAPVGDKLELRVKSPSMTSGYWGDSKRTAEAIDEEGFFRSGDAARLADPDNPAAGLVFDGRLADDFKLVNDSWVNTARPRAD
jgi:feruloyl-CoA synthase